MQQCCFQSGAEQLTPLGSTTVVISGCPQEHACQAGDASSGRCCLPPKTTCRVHLLRCRTPEVMLDSSASLCLLAPAPPAYSSVAVQHASAGYKLALTPIYV